MAEPKKTPRVALAQGVSIENLGAALPYVVYVVELRSASMIYINRDLSRELGYPRGALDVGLPQLFESLMHEEDRAAVLRDLARWDVATDDDILEAEYRLRDSAGHWRWYLSRDCVLERDAEGRVLTILGTALDITERKSLEARLQVSQKLEALGRLAGGIAHDFNNILTAVLGNAELARAALDDREWVADCLDQIRNAAEQASALTRSLLAFARQQVLRPEVLEVRGLLREIQRLLRRLLGEDIELRLELAENAGAVLLDRSQLTQIVLNLAVNARDAMPEGGVLTIRTAAVEIPEGGDPELHELAPGPYLALSVTDTGVGMDLATQAQIFEPFFSTKPEQRGSGLGLATVYGIVRQCEGTITVRSEVGQGSTFAVYLPQVAEQPAPSEERAAVHPAPRDKASILLVEDAAPVAAVVREVLERAGYRVTLARDGAQARMWLQSADAIDLLIADLILPGCSGIDLAREARERWPESGILVVSGHARAIDDDELVALRAEFMAKPFTPEAILERVNGILAQTGDAAG
ncbi:MAG: ATP-binding protein [Nannocystaceae bacterium]